MTEKRVCGGKGYDQSKGRTMDDMKAEVKWKERKDRDEHRERDKKEKRQIIRLIQQIGQEYI